MMQLVTQSNLKIGAFPGVWRLRYWYPSNQHAGEDISEYEVVIEGNGAEFSLHSLPNAINAYMQAHFSVLSNLATGTWLENTSPSGEFAGLVYSGAFQAIIAEDGKHLSGKWVGIGRDDPAPRIFEGKWEIDYLRES